MNAAGLLSDGGVSIIQSPERWVRLTTSTCILNMSRDSSVLATFTGVGEGYGSRLPHGCRIARLNTCIRYVYYSSTVVKIKRDRKVQSEGRSHRLLLATS